MYILNECIKYKSSSHNIILEISTTMTKDSTISEEGGVTLSRVTSGNLTKLHELRWISISKQPKVHS